MTRAGKDFILEVLNEELVLRDANFLRLEQKVAEQELVDFTGAGKDFIVGVLNEELVSRDANFLRLEQKVAEQELLIEEQARRIDILESNGRVQEIVNRHLTRSIDDQNQYVRRQNLIIDGLFIPKGAKDEEIRQIAIKQFRKMKLEINSNDVARAHRTGKPFYDSNGKLHVPILIRFLSWHPRNLVHENRNEARGVFFRADLTERRQRLLDDLK